MPNSGGVTGWDLYSTLALQASYVDYYATQPPLACPNDGEPLRLGPPNQPGTWYCPYDGWKYPNDWDPAIHSGM